MQDSVQVGDGPSIPSLAELDPEHDQTGVGVSAAHIVDKLDLYRLVLVGMMVRSVGAVGQGLQRPVVAFASAVDVLTVGVVAYGRFRYSVFQRILPILHRLCYLIHSE